ncbi:tumor susceptibility gene 101 protein-like isoform X1 [Centruroides sculpturatus]|uniref:tumor susceptibility gene 101 protein-like isoform X1 n=1 Tax=Centruroides sculpturatus TaxID=218467 RepID=UPI000C6DB5BE|nr:tumor susceptibility gene 101 protein-like isoform X1 [Centruroides sculpturatus]
MPQDIQTKTLVSSLLINYRYVDQAKRDICNALQLYKSLYPKRQQFVFNDGSSKELVCLDGTIPVPFKGNTYNIPVCIWILDAHPETPPMCYVNPTPEMEIKASKSVDMNGRIYLPYLHDWNSKNSDLVGLIQVMIIVFGDTPPVYSKPRSQDPPTSNLPYPTQISGAMPMPNVAGSGYHPYPPTSGASSYPYPYPTMPSYSNTSQGYPYPYPSAYPPQNTNSYQSGGCYPPSSIPSSTPSNTGTISEEHIHASLLSAVEDKLKKKLRDVLSQTHAEMEVLKKTQDDLNKGKVHLTELVKKLQAEQMELERNICILREKNQEMKEVNAKMENEQAIDIDEAVVTTAPLYRQLLNAFSEENATEDAIYYLGEALRKGVIDLDVFLKHVRDLSRKQFMLRALMQVCRQKAGLPH